MNTRTLATLARLRVRTDGDRTRLLACSVSAACALVLVAARIVRLWWADPSHLDGDPGPGLSEYLVNSGVRVGVVLAALLLSVPLLAFAGQALRVGGAARDRVSAVLRLAGATPRDTRWISALESGFVAAVGGVLGGPVFLALWVVLGRWPPSGFRFLPDPGWPDLVGWAALVVLAGAAGTVGGALIGRRVHRDPLGVSCRDRSGPSPLRLVVIGPALMVGLAAVVLGRDSYGAGSLVATVVVVAVLVVVCLASAPWAVVGLARLAQRSRVPARVLAGYRLAGDPWSPARATGVLVVCGVALGVVAALVASTPSSDQGVRLVDDFYAQGYAATGGCVLVAVVVSVATLFVGAVERLVDGPRPIAALHALGVEEAVLRRVLRTELLLTTVPATLAGVLAGAVIMALWIRYTLGGVPGVTVPVVAVTLLVSGLAVGLAGLVTSTALRGRLTRATDPDNLRTT